MKVGFVAPLSIAAVHGGVRTQALKTADHFDQQKVQVSYVSPWQEDLDVDLIHIFSAGPETLAILQKASDLGIKTVLSPVFFSNRSAATISNALKAEKVVGKIGSGIRSDFGIKKQACEIADIILPNTSEEENLIVNGLGISHSKVSVVPNGVESRFSGAQPESFQKKYGLADFVLFVGQAGAPRKNVFRLLENAPTIDSEIVIVGSFYDDEYGHSCRELADSAGNVTLIEHLDHESELLASSYAACNTFVLPSMYETPGIAALEAALAGAKIVITQHGGTRDYFKEWAEYVDPQSGDSIARAINHSLKKTVSDQLRDHIHNNYTWPKISALTLQKYEEVLS